MRGFFLFFFIFFLSATTQGADNSYSYKILEDSDYSDFTSDSLKFIIDHSNKLTIEEAIQQLAASKEHLSEMVLQENIPNTHIWTSITIKNTSDQIKNEYFQFCKLVQFATVFTVEDTIVQDIKLTGSGLKPSEKSMPLSSNQILFGLDPGKTKTFYFKIEFQENTPSYHFTHLYIRSGKDKLSKIINTYTWQAFYIGIMALFSLMSFFMCSIFREKVFIYLGMIMIFFALYFMALNGILYAFFDITNPPSSSLILRIIISFVLISGYLFTSEYISLKSNYKKYFNYYTYFTIIASLSAHILLLFSSDIIFISWLNNVMIAIWLLLTIAPVILLVKRKDKSARILLISFGSMVISALLYTSNLIFNVTYSGWTKDSFQIGVIIFSGILFYGLFDKINTIKLEKQQMKNLDELKSRFFSNISHEFRTPLTLIMAPIKELSELTEKRSDKKLLQLAYQNSERLLQLINQLLDLSKLEAGKMQFHASEQNFIVLMKEILGSFESLAHQKNIVIKYDFAYQNIPLYVDRDKIEKIFYNLISNAIKFSKDGISGEILVSVLEQKNSLKITVKDNGVGIPTERLPYIFDRFFQIEYKEYQKHEGTGIGLALVKELVELHHGSIRVESKNSEGCTFTIELPKGKNHLNENEITDLTTQDKEPSILTPNENDINIGDEQFSSALEKNQTKPSVLVVEDNMDVRNYIKTHLAASYHVLEADNGTDGILMTIKHQPELVISDVMMPQKNGYELTHSLKNDPRTSHIPIILLTAKAGQEEKITGLETGADDYLVKPFNSKELDIRVANLIQIRKELRKRFSEHGPVAAQKTSGINSVDKSFLDKVIICIDVNFPDNTFSIDMLANEVGMSKVHLNRKLKALTDFSTNKFIQTYRLQKALKMLQEKEGNVSEIAHKTGFNSTAYFVKCFREKYQITPGSILEN